MRVAAGFLGVAAAIAATLALVALPVVALGHASLVSSDPPAGGTISTSPDTLTATFDDELTADGSSIVVENAAGTQVTTGTVSAGDAHTMTAALPPLPNGNYTVKWTAVSADDQDVERGTHTFTVGATTVSTPAPTPQPAGSGTGTGGDVLIAVGLAAVVIVAVVAFIFVRGRR